ncbi:MAG: hypothetical protein ACNS62_07705 [Candidatus Cyclobacteriaceae bacterium M3_2C_046]
MAEQKEKKEEQNKEIEKKEVRENRIKSQTQGSEYVSKKPNKGSEERTDEQADFDKMVGNEKDQKKKDEND